jgi:hypothetical protein
MRDIVMDTSTRPASERLCGKTAALSRTRKEGDVLAREFRPLPEHRPASPTPRAVVRRFRNGPPASNMPGTS